ncbi:MAG TPA: phosphodiester glycosidase family protein [bacterium]|nr:phosphodiester glycosidase family protein [bacterium]
MAQTRLMAPFAPVRWMLLALTLLIPTLPTVPGQAASLFDQGYPENQPVRIEDGPPQGFDPGSAAWQALPGLPNVRYTLFQEFILVALTGETPDVTMETLEGPDRLVLRLPAGDTKLPKPTAVQFPEHNLLTEIRAALADGTLTVVVETTVALPVQELADAPEGWRIFWFGTKFEIRTHKTVVPGISYLRRVMVDATGQRRVHIVRAEIKKSGFEPTVITAADANLKRAKVRTMMTSWGGLLGINGGYFDGAGRPQGLIIRDGQLVNKPVMERPCFVLNHEGVPAIGFLPVIGLCTGDTCQLQFDKVNGHYDGSDVVLLTPGHPARLSEDMKILDAWKVVIRDDTVVRVGFEPLTNAERQQRHVLLVPAAMAHQAGFQPGEKVLTKYMVGRNAYNIDLALQAGPMLVLDGQVRVSTQGDFPGDIRRGRAPRSAVGLTANGELLLVAVDGRSKIAAGATLTELAGYLVEAGAKVAMNLDGGSSTQLIVGEDCMTVNPAGEKPVANALVLIDTLGRYGRKDFYF